jgi:hypothetical protein
MFSASGIAVDSAADARDIGASPAIRPGADARQVRRYYPTASPE